MNERELSLVKALGEEFQTIIGEIKQQCDQAIAHEKRRTDDALKELEGRLGKLESREEPDISKAISEAVDALPSPELPDINKLIDDAVKKAVEDIRVPADGKSVTVEDISPILEKMVKDAVGALPSPELPALPDIDEMVKAAVGKAVAEWPVPENGKSVTVEDISPILEKMVKDAVGALPSPELPALPDIGVLVESAVSKAFAELPAPEMPQPGRDALQIEILPSIDEEKSYPRGTYATHNGGLWRTFEKTHAMRGWECLVDGVAATDISHRGERSFDISITRSSGQTEQKSFELPVMIYRDVFKSGETYQPGDTVTWAGSLWHCNEKSGDKPGEPGSKGWTLAAKRGRDARAKS